MVWNRSARLVPRELRLFSWYIPIKGVKLIQGAARPHVEFRPVSCVLQVNSQKLFQFFKATCRLRNLHGESKLSNKQKVLSNYQNTIYVPFKLLIVLMSL